MTLEVTDIMEILPHRYPMLLVDRIIELEPMKYAVGVKNATFNELFSRDIFRVNRLCPVSCSLKRWHRLAALPSCIPKRTEVSYLFLQALTSFVFVIPSVRAIRSLCGPILLK